MWYYAIARGAQASCSLKLYEAEGETFLFRLNFSLWPLAFSLRASPSVVYRRDGLPQGAMNRQNGQNTDRFEPRKTHLNTAKHG